MPSSYIVSEDHEVRLDGFYDGLEDVDSAGMEVYQEIAGRTGGLATPSRTGRRQALVITSGNGRISCARNRRTKHANSMTVSPICRFQPKQSSISISFPAKMPGTSVKARSGTSKNGSRRRSANADGASSGHRQIQHRRSSRGLPACSQDGSGTQPGRSHRVVWDSNGRIRGGRQKPGKYKWPRRP